jgi:hypothetical protein
MRITTEASLRRIVRRIISEAKGTAETVTVTNSMRTAITVVGVYADTDTVKAENLLPEPVEIAAAATGSVAFTPTTDGTEFKIIATRFQGSGVTPGYSRGQLSVDYTLSSTGNTGTAEFDVASTGAAPGSNYIDDTEMAAADIDELVKPGEEYEIMDDPTDAEFKYAVFFVKTPTRAVVIQAPTADYKGKKIVSSMGEEISPRRYGGSFRKIADAFVEKMKTPKP